MSARQRSRDGRWLILRTAPTTGRPPTSSASRRATPRSVPLVATPAVELFPALSPDGRWLAYASNESGTFEVYVRPFPETASAKWQVSTAGGNEPAWSSTGRELFYINAKGDMVSAEIPAGGTFSVGRQRILFSTAQLVGGGPVPSYSLSPDNKRFLVLREGEAGQPGELVVAENWQQQLKAQAGR